MKTTLFRILMLAVAILMLSASWAMADNPRYLPLLFKQARVMPQGFVILDHTYFAPYSGSSSVYFVGEAQNNTGHIAKARLHVILRNAQGHIVGQDDTSLRIYVTNPGQQTPFRLIFPNCPAFTSYDMYVTWKQDNEGPKMLEASEVTAGFSEGSYVVRGKVRNPYTFTISDGEAAVSLYNAQGCIVSSDLAFLSPLAPGEIKDFDVSVTFYKGRPDISSIASYRLWVYVD